MEINVWMQLFAQVANFLSSRFASLNNQRSQSNGGASPNAPASDAASISTSTNATILAVMRDPKKATIDALFGTMKYNDEQIGFTMERKAVAIPEGTYHSCKEISPHFGFATPHLQVEGRTYIEIHPANYPAQLEGCIAVGTTIDNDSLDNSRAAFDKMMAAVPEAFTVIVQTL
jgi:uncharacterized protein DUF5675